MAFGLAVLPAQRRADARQQDLVVKGLFEEIRGADLHGLDRQRHVAVARNHDHRHADLEFLQPAQQLDAAHARHPHVGDDAAGTVFGQRLEKRRGRSVVLNVDLGLATGMPATGELPRRHR